MAITEPLLPPPAPPEPPPPLQNGDHLTRTEFERRYDAMPELKKAELIEGVVYMPSPVRIRRHSRPHVRIAAWAGIYEANTPGVIAGDNGSIRMDLRNMPQPDVFLCLEPECGGQARIDDDDYLEGAPEFVLEVAASSASYDLHEKMAAYQRNGVQEYVVWRVEDRDVDWLHLREGRYEKVAPGEDGVYRSEVFPGLWLDAAALVHGDMRQVHRILAEGLAAPEHAAFVARNAAGS